MHTVVIDSLRFDPQDLTIEAGDTIVWISDGGGEAVRFSRN